MDASELARLLAEANVAHDEGDDEGAKRSLEEILNRNPESVPAAALFSRLFGELPPGASEQSAVAQAEGTRPWGFGEAEPSSSESGQEADWSEAIDAAWGTAPDGTLVDFSLAQQKSQSSAESARDVAEEPSVVSVLEATSIPGATGSAQKSWEVAPGLPPTQASQTLGAEATNSDHRAPPAPPRFDPQGEASAVPVWHDDPWGDDGGAAPGPVDGTLLDFKVEGLTKAQTPKSPTTAIAEVASPRSPEPGAEAVVESSSGDVDAKESKAGVDAGRPASQDEAPPAPALELLSSPQDHHGTRSEEETPSSGDLRAHSDVDSLLKGANELIALADFSGALELLERITVNFPDHSETLALVSQCEATLVQMLESKLTPLERCPRVLLETEEIVWLNLDHRAGFVLAQIDGAVSYDEIFALSGMSRLDTCRILVQLLEQRVITS